MIPVCYADVIPRRPSGRLAVSLRGWRYPGVGRICVEQMIVNCGDEKVGEGGRSSSAASRTVTPPSGRPCCAAAPATTARS
ncbi:alanine racemase C-terminal domain-containing protein [Streptomyces griseoluteus]|uniref:alanine racemase C-terminal domain-containing protein n=1 Tax=Streptomyces griseoluteus TaxID=29306 RepID=UPI0038239009